MQAPFVVLGDVAGHFATTHGEADERHIAKIELAQHPVEIIGQRVVVVAAVRLVAAPEPAPVVSDRAVAGGLQRGDLLGPGRTRQRPSVNEHDRTSGAAAVLDVHLGLAQQARMGRHLGHATPLLERHILWGPVERIPTCVLHFADHRDNWFTIYDMRIAMLIVDGVADSGLALMRDVFAAANLLAAHVDTHIDPFAVSLRATHDEVRTAYGLTVSTQPLSAMLGEPPDVLITPSLGLVTAEQILHAVITDEAIPMLRECHERGVALAGACSGTFFLAEAGLLAGRDATTSWWLGPTFRARYPSVRLDESQAACRQSTTSNRYASNTRSTCCAPPTSASALWRALSATRTPRHWARSSDAAEGPPPNSCVAVATSSRPREFRLRLTQPWCLGDDRG